MKSLQDILLSYVLREAKEEKLEFSSVIVSFSDIIYNIMNKGAMSKDFEVPPLNIDAESHFGDSNLTGLMIDQGYDFDKIVAEVLKTPFQQGMYTLNDPMGKKYQFLSPSHLEDEEYTQYGLYLATRDSLNNEKIKEGIKNRLLNKYKNATTALYKQMNNNIPYIDAMKSILGLRSYFKEALDTEKQAMSIAPHILAIFLYNKHKTEISQDLGNEAFKYMINQLQLELRAPANTFTINPKSSEDEKTQKLRAIFMGFLKLEFDLKYFYAPNGTTKTTAISLPEKHQNYFAVRGIFEKTKMWIGKYGGVDILVKLCKNHV